MGRRGRSASPTGVLPPLRCEMALPPACPQLVDPRIDVLAHCLIQRLVDDEHMASGMRRATYSLLQPTRPLVMILTTECTGHGCDAMGLNLAALANAAGVPVVWALSREHMGRACGSPRPTSACAVLGLPDEHAKGLLCAMLTHAEAASAAWRAQTEQQPLDAISCL